MSPESQKRLAMARLRERARRINLIRRSVIAAAVATFALAWGLALNDQIAHGTKTSPTSGSNQSPSSGGSAIPSSSEQTGSDEGYVPVTPVQSNVVPVAPAPAPTPAPVPLTTSQS